MSHLSANVDSRLGRLSTLPGELRNQIYEYALCDGHIAFEGLQTKEGKLQVRPRGGSVPGLQTFRALCLTSSLVAAEARPLFFKVNRFEIALGEYKEGEDEVQHRPWWVIVGLEKEDPASSVLVPKTYDYAKTFSHRCLPQIEDLVIKWDWDDHFGIRARTIPGSRLAVGWFADEGYEEEMEERRQLGIEVEEKAKMDEKLVAKLWRRLHDELPALVTP